MFGKRIVIVYATALYGYAEWEQQFLFHTKATKEEIKNCLWHRNDGKLERFSVEIINRTRSKEIEPIESGKYKPLNKAKVTKWYDD